VGILNNFDSFIIDKIYEYWDENRAKVVETLYKYGRVESSYKTEYIRSILPSLANTARWKYKDRIIYELLQPDLFPETLKSDFEAPDVVKIAPKCADEWIEPVYDI
jgi:hypothetical protein